jgi:hypothetical protein
MAKIGKWENEIIRSPKQQLYIETIDKVLLVFLCVIFRNWNEY